MLCLTAALSAGIASPLQSGAQEQTSAPAPGSLLTPTSKPDAVVKGEVRDENSFDRDIGRGLIFRLVRSPESYGKGWDIQVVPKDVASGFPEYATVATPPYHLYKPTYLNASYGVTAEEAVAMNPRRFQFVETPHDSQAATVVMQTMVYTIDWHLHAKQLQEEAGKIPVGIGELRIMSSRVTKGKNSEDLGSVDQLEFEARFWLASGVTLKDVLFAQQMPK